MARVTVEDCLDVLDTDRFDLTLLAASRARQIANGSKPLIDNAKDKPTVVALREIADGKMNQEIYDQIELSTKMAESKATYAESET